MKTGQNPSEDGSSDPTKEIVQAARSGDLSAWRSLDGRYRTSLALLVRGKIPCRLRSRFDTEDILQSVFLSAFKDIDQYEYRGRGSFRAWLAKILHLRIQERIRRHYAGKRDARVESGPGYEGSSPLSFADESLKQAESHADLLEAVGRLEPPAQLVINGYFFDRMSIADLAWELGVSASTVSRRISKALGELLSVLQE